MFGLAAAALDALHAVFMVLQVAGLPLFFWHRWPRLSRGYALYAVSFIALNQGSKLLLGECFLTTWARWLWSRAVLDPSDVPGEWFTVRVAQWVFHMTPSHRAVSLAGELLMLVTAIGVLALLRHARRTRRAASRVDRALPVDGAHGQPG
jgi:hypothetical protein